MIRFNVVLSTQRTANRSRGPHPTPERSSVTRINHTNRRTDEQRPHTRTHRIANELSDCEALLCLDLVSFPLLIQIKPQAPLLVVPFRQCLYVSGLRPYAPRKP